MWWAVGAPIVATGMTEFGGCTVTGSCEAVCPKEISLDFIARMNRDFGVALLKGDSKAMKGGGAG